MTSDIRHDPLAKLSAPGVAVWLDDLALSGAADAGPAAGSPLWRR